MKAFVTIEVEIDEYQVGKQRGCSEIEPMRPSARREAEIEAVWDLVAEWLKDQTGFSQIIKVVLPKKQVQNV